MKKVHRIDTNGYFIEDVILEDNEETPRDCVDLEIPEGFYKPQFTNGIWTEGLSQDTITNILGLSLDELKQQKTNELDQSCKNAILANFIATINGIDYEFANDIAAQTRFNGIAVLFLGNKIADIEWTAYQNGERGRITLTKDDFDVVTLAALKHQDDNVKKYSDLYVKVMNATTANEVNQIVW